MSTLAGAFGWIMGLVYLGVPVLAAVLLSQKGPERYLAESEATMTRWLRFIVAFYAYLSLLTDRLPASEATAREAVRFEVAPSGSPSAGNTLLRLILAIPSAFVLSLLWLVGVILLVIAAISILLNETYPSAIYDFLRGLNRWGARLLVYLASLVEQYPPFAFDSAALTELTTSGPQAAE